ncbi:hypothetical protein [Mycolicibacterium sp. P1-18]|uniref:hypothetical protein n=1 Tax=Mycolicibacterium sp. P1-18 TaxID=2024615 RepID=UPI0018D88B31|nr:hypothetical protein [Mycolicibacterium sp. P1-18]
MIVRYCCLVVAALVAGCSSPAEPPAASPTATPATSTPASTTTPPPAPAARTVNWFELAAGDCLADPPPVDPTVIGVAVVDCSSPHHAEVYLRAPLAVDAAITDVAGRKCNEGFTEYTGEPVGSGTFGVSYLIDSNQNRTSSNPNPSTVICLLEAVDGSVLTVPARR